MSPPPAGSPPLIHLPPTAEVRRRAHPGFPDSNLYPAQPSSFDAEESFAELGRVGQLARTCTVGSWRLTDVDVGPRDPWCGDGRRNGRRDEPFRDCIRFLDVTPSASRT